MHCNKKQSTESHWIFSPLTWALFHLPHFTGALHYNVRFSRSIWHTFVTVHLCGRSIVVVIWVNSSTVTKNKRWLTECWCSKAFTRITDVSRVKTVLDFSSCYKINYDIQQPTLVGCCFSSRFIPSAVNMRLFEGQSYYGTGCSSSILLLQTFHILPFY